MSENRRPPFPTLDPDSPFGGAEAVPSVTVLLDLRRLQKQGPKKGAEKVPGGVTASKPHIKVTARGPERRARKRLDLLSGELIARGNTPELQVLRRLFEKQADWAVLFLKEEESADFRARAVAGGSRERWAVWTGMKMGPEVSQGLWGRLAASDHLELAQTGADAPTLFSALGCRTSEQVWIFWVGPRSEPLALLMVGGNQLKLDSELAQELAKTLA